MARHVFDRIDSTNAQAMRLAPSLSGPAWIMARDQTAGRGRRGRTWVMPAGNFAATLVMRSPGQAQDAARLGFIAGLAVHDALAAACGPAARLAIKWPNDVLLNGGKVSGILLEGLGGGGAAGVDLLAVGIGVNLAAAPGAGEVELGALPPVSVASETGHAVSPDDFLDLLAPAFADWQATLARGGFAPIRAAWMARAAKLGQTITARTGPRTRTGRFDGIDESGALVLTTAEGREVVPAADVYFAEGA